MTVTFPATFLLLLFSASVLSQAPSPPNWLIGVATSWMNLWIRLFFTFDDFSAIAGLPTFYFLGKLLVTGGTQSCAALCLSNAKCTHFTYSDSDSNCIMQQFLGPIPPPVPVVSPPTLNTCGFILSPSMPPLFSRRRNSYHVNYLSLMLPSIDYSSFLHNQKKKTCRQEEKEIQNGEKWSVKANYVSQSQSRKKKIKFFKRIKYFLNRIHGQLCMIVLQCPFFNKWITIFELILDFNDREQIWQDTNRRFVL